MSTEPAFGLSALGTRGLPLNRKERYYTGTVLPMIVASEGMVHLGSFLQLCGAPHLAIENDPRSTNVQFFTEYGFKESLVDGAERRFREPAGRDTPDLVIYVEGKPSVLVGIEAKMFHRPSLEDLNRQLGVQRELLLLMAEGLVPKPTVVQVALLPGGLHAPDEIEGVQVLTWERVAEEYRETAPAYWLGVLDQALERYDQLSSPSGGDRYRKNNDDLVSGRRILEMWESGDRTFECMGRIHGLDGDMLRGDLESGEWCTRTYEVRHDRDPPNRNWFPIEAFVELTRGYA